MEPYSLFILNSILFGVGLAMDAFSVSMANGLREPDMKTGRMCIIAGTFAFFQVLMPLLGWVCVHTIAEMFEGFQRLIPWIALLLLGYIGGKMLFEGVREAVKSNEEKMQDLENEARVDGKQHDGHHPVDRRRGPRREEMVPQSDGPSPEFLADAGALDVVKIVPVRQLVAHHVEMRDEADHNAGQEADLCAARDLPAQ